MHVKTWNSLFSTYISKHWLHIPLRSLRLCEIITFHAREPLLLAWYISRQAAKVARRYSECILASLAPLREHNISCEKTITSCEIYFSPSRQGRKVYILIYLSAPSRLCEIIIFHAREPLLLARYISRQAAKSAKEIYRLCLEIIRKRTIWWNTPFFTSAIFVTTIPDWLSESMQLSSMIVFVPW